jgi:hypothetical protein
VHALCTLRHSPLIKLISFPFKKIKIKIIKAKALFIKKNKNKNTKQLLK